MEVIKAEVSIEIRVEVHQINGGKLVLGREYRAKEIPLRFSKVD